MVCLVVEITGRHICTTLCSSIRKCSMSGIVHNFYGNTLIDPMRVKKLLYQSSGSGLYCRTTKNCLRKRTWGISTPQNCWCEPESMRTPYRRTARHYGRLRALTQDSILLFYPTGPQHFSLSILIKWLEEMLATPCSSCLIMKRLDIVCRRRYFTYVPKNPLWMNFDLQRTPRIQMSNPFFDNLSHVSRKTVMDNMTQRR